jgi:cytochrome P450
MARLLARHAASSEPVDFAYIAQYFALDVLTDLAFGEPLGFLSTETDLFSYIEKSANFLPLMELGTNHPWVHRILTNPLVSFLAGPKPGDKTGLGAVMGVVKRAISQRFEGCLEEGHRRDMLDSFISHGLNQDEAESESMLQILAGADSAATCVRMTMLYLLTNPRTYIKLQTEIREAVRTEHVSTPVIRNQEAAALPYLQACIKEGLRLWIPLNGLNTKVAPQEGVEINDVWIPGGTQVAHAHHAMMRRPDIFGVDAHIFDPDRWLSGDADTIKTREKVWELSFSYGRSVCLGRPIALMELNKVIFEVSTIGSVIPGVVINLITSQMLRRFDFGLVNPVAPIKTKCHQIHIQERMFLRIWAAPVSVRQ